MKLVKPSRTKRIVSHLLLCSFGLDSALFAQVRPMAAPLQRAQEMAAPSLPVAKAEPPAGGEGGTAVGGTLPLAAPLFVSSLHAPSSAGDSQGACEDVLNGGQAPLATVAQSQLWPPNHTLRNVGLSVDVTSACAGRVSVYLRVFADEPDEGPTGDGDLPGDARIDAPDLFLRSERRGDADGRVYLVLATATAASGVSGTGCAVVGVAHSRSQADLASLRSQMDGAKAYCDANDAAPSAFYPLTEGYLLRPNLPPQVTAGPDQAVDFPGPASLDGTASDDGLPFGVLNLTWGKVSGPGDVTFAQPHAEDTTATFSEPGTFVLSLTGDDTQLTTTDEITVVVSAAANQAPSVNAGEDQDVTLPASSVTLTGTATDDGRPSGVLTTVWSGPSGVVFADPHALTTTATLPGSGEYLLVLTASDTQFEVSDQVRVRVNPEPPPVLAVSDAAADEGQEGTTGAVLNLTLSKSWPRPVSIDYMTAGGTATAGCDYRTRYGTLTIPAGETTAGIVVPVMGEVVPEPDETVVLRMGNAVEATLDRTEAVVTIRNDDGANRPPLPASTPTPLDGSTGVTLPPALSWSTGDPDAGDAVTSDLHLGTSFGTTGQSWVPSCAATAGPASRSAAASGYDEAGDRLIVHGGRLEGPGDPDTVWVLENASATGGTPRWEPLSVPGGPTGVLRASGSYDAATNRLIIHGGCLDSACSSASGDTWLLTNASGLGGTPEWIHLVTGGPAARMGHVAAYDAASNRLIVFGGSVGGSDLDDVWVLANANGLGGGASWERLTITGTGPAPRWGMSGVYDAAAHRLVVFGGRTSDGTTFADVWVLEHASGLGGDPAWQKLQPGSAGPASRWGHAAAYDPVSGRMVVFGGTKGTVESGQNFVFADSWMLTNAGGLPVAAEWVKLAPGPGGPVGRFEAVSAYSSGLNRWIVALGANNKVGPPADLWALADAVGSLPLLVGDLQAPGTTPLGLVEGETYSWKVVTRDSHGAFRGSSVWRFTSNRPPLVNAGEDQTITLPASAALVGSASDDGLPQGSVLVTRWSVLSGPAGVTFGDPASVVTTATFGGAGTYVLALTATDSVLTVTDEIAVTVLPANLAPVVDAGPDQVLLLPQTTATLGATVSDDGLPAGSTLALAWTKVSGPGTVAFDAPNQAATTATFGAPGVYALRLTASDSALAASDDVAVSVRERSDLVVNGVDVSGVVYEGQTLQISGTVAATIANLGGGPASGSFAVALFEDRNGNGVFEPAEDNLLGTGTQDGLAAGATATVTASVSGAVLFRGNLIHAFVDSADAVVESDETNNYGRSAPPCAFTPSTKPFAAKLKWSWTGSALAPNATNVAVTPLVVDLNGDGTPDVLFVSFSTTNGLLTDDGYLRAVDGATGQELFTVTDPALMTEGVANLAAGDIDRDGRPEIVAGALGSTKLIAFEHDGTFKWLSPTLESFGWGGPALADLDGDGVPEIVVGRQVLNADGTLRWTGPDPGGRGAAREGGYTVGCLSAVADLDMDGTPEVMAGNTAYRADGSILWQVAAPDGLVAVGNLDDDPYPEIALVGDGQVRLLDHDGVIQWGPVAIPGGGGGGAPTLADFDGDGRLEIGVAGAVRYSVFDRGGQLKWAAVIQDASSNVTSSSVFDFEADGAAEVVYADELKLWVYRGADGHALLEQELGSCTAFENPVVADVDGDGSAEIVAVANVIALPACPQGTRRGVFVFDSANDPWVATRKIWNQHTYHITNVNDDGTIPAHERNNWETYNNYRQNRLTQGCEYRRPDLIPSYARKQASGESVMLTARVGNAGTLQAPAGVSVSFYDGDPASGGTRLGVATTTQSLVPGRFEEVTLAVPGTSLARPLWVVADDPGTIDESDETNNAYDSRLFLSPVPNAAPTVDAGPDQRLVSPQTTAALDGTVSDDGQPLGRVTVRWATVQGPGAVMFGSPASEDTTATFPTPGTYVLRLTADDEDKQAADDVTIVVEPPNQAPVVDAGPDQSVTQLTAALDGAASDDGLPTGGALTVEWGKLEGPGTVAFGDAHAVDTSVTFGAPGHYVLALTASDSAASASDTVAIDATLVNGAPVVEAGPDQTLTLPASQTTLVGSATDDGLPAGSTLTFLWTAVDPPGVVAFGSPTESTTTATFSDPGVYALKLTASDGEQRGSDVVQVTVGAAAPSGDPPVVALTTPLEGDRVTGPAAVSGTAQSDTLASWKLEYRRSGEEAFVRFASGTTPVVSGPLGTFDPTLTLNGIYELRLTATDISGRSARTSTRVVVKDNQKVGHFSVSFVDLEVPVAGLPIRVTRTYDSRDKGKGDFGFGWRMDVSTVRVQESGIVGSNWQGTVIPGYFPSYCLQPIAPQVVTVTLPDGRVLEFDPVVTPQCQTFVPISEATMSFQARPGTLAQLRPSGDGFVWVEGGWPGVMQLFDGTSYDVFDPKDYVLVFPDGRELSLDQVKGLVQIKDLNGNVLTVSSNGITHSSGVGITMTRDAEGRIKEIKDPDGHAMTYGYDGSGDLRTFTDRESRTTSFTYNEDFRHHLATINDPLGRTPIRNEYYDDGRIKSHTDAFGKTITYAHDLTGRQEVVTDRDGRVRVLLYDERGNVVKETDPEGKVVDRTFDARNNRTSETVPHDPAITSVPTSTYVYDDRDDLRSVTDPLSHTTEYTYNARKQVVLAKDPRGNFTLNTYDAKGNLLSTKVSTSATGEPALSETAYTYTASGNVETQTTVVDGVALTTRYAYDGSGNLTKETDALGHETSYTYDGRGNRLTQTTTRTLPGGATETLVTSYEYDRNGLLKKTTDADGSFTETVYDAMGKQRETRDKLGRPTQYDYDEMGRLTKTTYPDLTTEESTYDGEGRRKTSKDRAGRTTSYDYDGLGRLKKTTYPDTSFSENTYDPAGRLVASKDARGKTTLYGYDDAGRRTSVRVPLDEGASLYAETLFTYDANGNQRTVRDANLHTTTFEYDEQNRRTKTIFPDSTYTETTCDVLGRRRAERDQAGKVTRFDYDGVGRLTKVTQRNAGTDLVTTYGYDEVGNRTSQTDANLHTTRFEHDKLGRETARVLPDGKRETKEYNAAGNLTKKVDFAGRETVYGYDDSSRLTTRTYTGASTEEVAFTYTRTGRLETITDRFGTTTQGYDLRDRLTQVLYPTGAKLEMAHDGNGNRTSLTAYPIVGDPIPASFHHDDAGRLDRVTDVRSRAYGLAYDSSGNRIGLSQPNNVATTYVYNTLHRLTSLTSAGGIGTVQSYALELGPAGNRTKVTLSGGVVRDYAYDDLYRLTQEKWTDAGTVFRQEDFTYDNVGNRLARTLLSSAGTTSTTYTYDDRDRLTTETPGSSPPTAYTYDDNGNLTTKDGEATYTWDRESRLTKVTKTDGTVVEHAYDAFGNRLQTTTTKPSQPTETINYLVDTSGGLSHVVADLDATGRLTAYYLRADNELIAILRPDGVGSYTAKYVHSDYIGSIRALTDDAGQVTDTYDYSAFGELLAHAGTDPQPYAFAGEPLDPNVGFQYHRARWMDPKSGRFLGMDPWAGSAFDPASLHRYLYANQDPLRYVDPTGRSSFSDMMSALASLQVLAMIALPKMAGVWSAITSNWFVIQATVDKVIFWFDVAGTTLGAVETATTAVSQIMDSMATTAMNANVQYPPGPGPRGLLFGHVVNQNLADNFPAIDHFEGGAAISIKTTTAVEMPGALVENVRTWATELSELDGVLNGRTAAGDPIQLQPDLDFHQRGLLVAIPHEGLAWHPSAITWVNSQLRQLNQSLKVAIRIVPVKRLRGQ